MLLRNGGMDIFYIDESHDSRIYAVTAIAVPFLRNNGDHWSIAWPDYLDAAKSWRKRIGSELHIPLSKELHGTKLVSGRGRFLYGKRQFEKSDAADAYKKIMSWIDFIPDASIITVTGTRGAQMFGHERLERVMYALFQRMRRQCNDSARYVNAMAFFDQGHPEYRRLYRRARINLPTGSMFGLQTRNLPLDMFVKDANEKTSHHCLFTQAADLIAYSALQKIRHERGLLEAEPAELRLHELYDALPKSKINLRANSGRPNDGIVRMD